MTDLLKPPSARALVHVTGTESLGTGGPSPTSGAGVALRSLEHLEQTEKKGSGTLQKALVAALLGLALIGAVKPAHADTLDVSVPQQHGLFLDAHQPTGPPDYAKVLGTTVSTTTSQRAVDARTQAAFKQFEARLTQVMQRDAGSLALGLRPIEGGASMTTEQTKQLKDALGDLVKELPVSSLSPELRGALESAAGRDLSGVRLGELGKIGGDAVKQLVENFREENPKAFWTMAGTAAAAAITVGYTQGTDALAKLGIKPELSTRLFDGVKLKVGLEAEARFKDPRVSVGLEGQHTFSSGTMWKGGIAAQLHGKDVVGAQLTTTVTTTGGTVVDGGLRLDGSGKPFDARLSVSGTQGRWTSSVSGTWDLQNDRFTGALSAGRTFDVMQKNDLDLQIRATHDSKGDSAIGVGVTLRF